MKKKFKLPKEFAEKWLIALRSGQYLQGEGFLAYFPEENGECNYCCLGVAGIVCGMELDNIVYREIYDSSQDLVPEEIIGEANIKSLVKILTLLNDGCSIVTLETTFKDLIFRDLHQIYSNVPRGTVKTFTFSEIANFIEDNCELY